MRPCCARRRGQSESVGHRARRTCNSTTMSEPLSVVPNDISPAFHLLNEVSGGLERSLNATGCWCRERGEPPSCLSPWSKANDIKQVSLQHSYRDVTIATDLERFLQIDRPSCSWPLRRNESVVCGFDGFDKEKALMCSASFTFSCVRRCSTNYVKTRARNLITVVESPTLGITAVVSKQLPVSGSAMFFGTIRVLTLGMRPDMAWLTT